MAYNSMQNSGLNYEELKKQAQQKQANNALDKARADSGFDPRNTDMRTQEKDVGIGAAVRPAISMDADTSGGAAMAQYQAALRAQDPSKYASDPTKYNVDPTKYNTDSTNRIQRRFDLLRTQTEQGVNADQQKNAEALQREAAAHGRLGSGSLNKQTMQLEKQGAGIKQNALQGIESQRDVAMGAQDEANMQRQFAADEANAGRNFQSDQANAGRSFASDQANLARMQASAETAVQHGFDAALFNKNMQFQQQTLGNQSDQFKQQMVMAQKQMDLDTVVSKFNMEMATKQFDRKGMLDTFFGNFSFDKVKDFSNTTSGGTSGNTTSNFGY